MSKKLRRGILVASLGAFVLGGWLGCGKDSGMEACPHCGQKFPIYNLTMHIRKCPQNKTDQKMNKPASGKTTVVK